VQVITFEWYKSIQGQNTTVYRRLKLVVNKQKPHETWTMSLK